MPDDPGVPGKMNEALERLLTFVPEEAARSPFSRGLLFDGGQQGRD